MEQTDFFAYIGPYLPEILDGFLLTLRLFITVLVIAMPLSVIFAVLKVSAPKPVRRLLDFYTWIFRGTPLLVQLLLVYNGFPKIGIVWDGWTCALLVFCLSVAAYETEVIRGGIISIEKGQYEACHVLGMSYAQTMWRVIIPQTVRRVLPTTCSEVIILLKDTSLVAGIAVFDLMRAARNIVMRDLRIEAFIVTFIIYLAVSSLLVLIFGLIEKRLAVSL